MKTANIASAIVNDLLNTNLTMRQLATLVPCSCGTIGMYKSGLRGKQPSHRIMVRLLALHKQWCKKPRSQV